MDGAAAAAGLGRGPTSLAAAEVALAVAVVDVSLGMLLFSLQLFYVHSNDLFEDAGFTTFDAWWAHWWASVGHCHGLSQKPRRALEYAKAGAVVDYLCAEHGFTIAGVVGYPIVRGGVWHFATLVGQRGSGVEWAGRA